MAPIPLAFAVYVRPDSDIYHGMILVSMQLGLPMMLMLRCRGRGARLQAWLQFRKMRSYLASTWLTSSTPATKALLLITLLQPWLLIHVDYCLCLFGSLWGLGGCGFCRRKLVHLWQQRSR